MAFGPETKTTPGSTYIGNGVYRNNKISLALKMFPNVTPSFTTQSTTATLPNTNSASIGIQRGS